MSSRRNSAVGQTLAWRLGLYYAGLFVASAVVLGVVTYVLLARALAAQDHDVLESMLTRYVAEYSRSGLGGLERLIGTDAREGRHERLLVRVVTGRADLVYFAMPEGWDDVDFRRLDGPQGPQAGWLNADDPDGGATLELGTANLGGGLRVQVGRSSHVRDDLLRRFRERAFEVGLLIVLIAGAGGVLLTRAALAPLRTLDATLRGILATGRFDTRVPTGAVTSDDPLDQLTMLVNQMLARIEQLVGGMRGALDNVAHDLRTPLTRFRNVAEAAVVADDPAAMREGLAQALEEAGRVNATLTALMDISQAETGTLALRRDAVRVAEVVSEAVDLFADEADDKGVRLSEDVPPDLPLVSDRTRLRQVLANLIENAVKYTDAGGAVRVSATPDGNGVAIVVEDTGIGIAAEQLPFIWDRLYRADPTRSTRGLGLGLSLVKAIVGAHGGEVDVASAPGTGSRFTVRLPNLS
ncbi:MAG: HAMP domain-containing histidine kinase [Acidobacteria bacterium]|nr:HAMP domain-containing histidine kinase [Acidobacteriota bacterium]